MGEKVKFQPALINDVVAASHGYVQSVFSSGTNGIPKPIGEIAEGNEMMESMTELCESIVAAAQSAEEWLNNLEYKVNES